MKFLKPDILQSEDGKQIQNATKTFKLKSINGASEIKILNSISDVLKSSLEASILTNVVFQLLLYELKLFYVFLIIVEDLCSCSGELSIHFK